MFVVVHNDHVVLGPVLWNRYLFEGEIMELSGQAITLPDSAPETVISINNDEIRILPVLGISVETYDVVFQYPYGPHWTFSELGATGLYTATNKTLEDVRIGLIKATAAARYEKQIRDIQVTINGLLYTVETIGKTVDSLDRKLRSTQNTIIWKFKDDQWAELDKTHIQDIINAIDKHVQSMFDWEFSIINSINSYYQNNNSDAAIKSSLQLLIQNNPELVRTV